MSRSSNLRADAFAGTAKAYARYRPPYPRSLLDDLLACAAVPEKAALLDLACGPGRATLELARSFETVWAIDLEPEMIEVGKQEAARRGIKQIIWLVGRAEALTLAPGSIDLITIGDAFHRLDQRRITQMALSWLKPGGCLATIGSEGILAGDEPWQMTIADIARRWTSRALPSGWALGQPGAELGPEGYARMLRRAGCVDVESRCFIEPRDWSIAEILGYLQSTSVCSERLLGDGFAALRAEVIAALGNQESLNLYRAEFRSGYTVGRKPT